MILFQVKGITIIPQNSFCLGNLKYRHLILSNKTIQYR
ncbi:hypothetical protein LEP1GSC196_1953 [Leptospira meyeri serovar Semaranga str. Veldrot Semarang 173]|nr:hypothetical protein LEP1GSC196_1953 [Leptospira meyeri serovar Semaranga str. Veldrot Semarang 173]